MKKSKTIICAALNNRPVLLVQTEDGNYKLRISGMNRGTFELFGEAVSAIEKETGVNYPF